MRYIKIICEIGLFVLFSFGDIIEIIVIVIYIKDNTAVKDNQNFSSDHSLREI